MLGKSFRTSVTCALLFVCTPATTGKVSAQGTLPAGTAIQAFWSSLDSVWNARDAARFSELFAVDSSFGFVDRGESLEGREAIYRSFAERFPRFAPNIRHRTTVNVISDIAPDVRTVDGTVEILRLSDDAEPDIIRTFSIFAVMLQTDEGWKIRELRAYQVPTAAAQDAG